MSWPFERMKYLVRINDRALPEDTDPDFEFRYIDITTVGRGVLAAEPERMRFSEAPSRARLLVASGDTIVSTVRTYLRAVWPVAADRNDLVVSTGFAVLTPRTRLEPRYLGWWAQSDPFVKEIVARSVGVSYPAINASDVGDLAMPLPPIAAQRAIADYLDAETARIDALIARKRRMIELLKERQTTLITDCAEGVCDPRQPRSPSAVSQRAHDTGRVRLRFLAAVNPPTPEIDLIDADAELPFLPLEAVWPGYRLDLSRRRPKGEVNTGYTRFREGDILIPKITPTFEADRTVLVRGLEGGVGAGSTELHVVRPRPGVEPRFLRYVFSSRPFLAGGEASMTGVAGQQRVPEEWVKDFPVCAFDLSTQRAIADYLDDTAVLIDGLVAKQRLVIEKLEEYRQALITAAVTGELAVPGAVA